MRSVGAILLAAGAASRMGAAKPAMDFRGRPMVAWVADAARAAGLPLLLVTGAHRHEVLGVRLYDPLEVELPDIGLVTLQDAETGENLFVDTHDAGFRRRFARQAEEREARLRDDFAQAGVDALELATDEPLLDAIIRFAELRKLRGRAGGGLARAGAGPATSMARAS